MSNTDRCDRIGWLAVVALLCAAAPAFGQASFEGLGDLPGGVFLSSATGVSSDGSVVVGTGRSASGIEAFRWEAGVMSGLGDFAGGTFDSRAYGVSGDGSMVVGTGQSGTGLTGYRWTQASGLVALPDLTGGPNAAQARGISADGLSIVGSGFTGAGSRATRWLSPFTGVVSLTGAAGGSLARGVSDDGTVVVGHGGSADAWRWTPAGGMVGLGDLPGGNFASAAFDVSGDGLVVVGQASSTLSGSVFEAFHWEGGVMTALGDLPGGVFDSRAYGISGDGSVVVGISSSTASGPGDWEAFIWDSVNGMRSLQTVLVNDFGLDLTGWTLARVGIGGISDDGLTIVGSGINPAGDTEAWVATLVPTPSCALQGDLNQDGLVRGDDIGGYVRAKLSQPPEPGEDPTCADFVTGTLDGDTAAFIAALLTGP